MTSQQRMPQPLCQNWCQNWCRRWCRCWRSLSLLLILSGSGVSRAQLPVALADGQRLPSLAPMLEQTTPAVVNIATYTTVKVRNRLLEDPFFRRFFNVPDSQRYRRTQSAGSGVVVDARRGTIITNHHVIDRADEILVTLADGRSLNATLVGSDPQVDLAVLSVNSDDLSQLAFADSDELRVGDFVVAIGNPFGLNQTVTSGIVSALGRTGLGIEGYEDFIQTDASINPGNSGGALVNLRGELTGINTAILAPSGGNVGIGFAIPANMVRAIADEIVEHGRVRRGYLGLAVQALNPELAEAFGLKRSEGVVVVEVEPGGVAEEAGVRTGDVILRMGQRAIERESDFHSQSAITFAGDRVPLTVQRDGRERRLRLKVAEESENRVVGARLDARLSGVELQNFRDQDDPAMSAGVLVTQVDAQSKPYAFGLRSGDIIISVNRRKIRNLADLRETVQRDSAQLLLRVYRAGQFGFIAIR
ncbi:MAG: Do family serine endopeptidase [Pseudomonadota bacterium]